MLDVLLLDKPRLLTSAEGIARGAKPRAQVGWRMAAGVRLVCSLWVLLAGCQGGYPIAPTACDEWCEVTKGLSCGFYDPSGCVSQCESQIMYSPRCRPLFDAALACFQSYPRAEGDCSYDPSFMPLPCDPELEAMSICQNY